MSEPEKHRLRREWLEQRVKELESCAAEKDKSIAELVEALEGLQHAMIHGPETAVARTFTHAQRVIDRHKEPTDER